MKVPRLWRANGEAQTRNGGNRCNSADGDQRPAFARVHRASRSSSRITCGDCHCPPRAIGMPASLSAFGRRQEVPAALRGGH
jgi:hypothetical protein